MTTPLLFLDIDGPLNPYRAKPRPDGYETFRYRKVDSGDLGRLIDDADYRAAARTAIRVWLNPAHGAAILDVVDGRYDLVWGTMWEGSAALVADKIGLPTDLPYVDFTDAWKAASTRHHPKCVDLLKHAAGRPFVWVDDEITKHDHAFFSAHTDAPFALYRVDASKGLLPKDFDALKALAVTLSA